ncbi:MAG: hypothetical protein JXB06_14020 [Spirochaetales bacterium]|nr:hypothetical protein [Spirochaetales bacterium]
MQDYKRAINQLQRDIDRNGGEILLRLRKLGEYLSYQDAALLPTAEMKELHERIGELRRQLPESRQQVKRILQTVAGNQELEREIRRRKLQITELSRRNQEICEAIGRAAYRAYKSLPAPTRSHDALFDTLDRQERGLADLEAEQESIQARDRDGKFFRIFRETGRSVYLKGLLSLRRKAVAKSYNEVGKKLCDSPLKDELKGGGLREALAPYESNEREISSLQGEIDKLQAEMAEKWNDLKNLGAHRSHQKRVREIESEIQRIEARLQDTFEALGTLFRSAATEGSEDAETAALIRQIREIESANRGKKKKIERLNAALQIESLNNQLGTLADKISKLEGEIEARSREIETLRAQMAGGEREIGRLQKIRGSKQSLQRDTKQQEGEEKE